MANIKQQKKRILVAQRQRSENLRYRSSIKTAFRRLHEAVQSGDSAAVDAAHATFVSLVDRAAARRALHPNTAARKKARATRVIARGPEVVETKKRRTTPKRGSRKAAAATPVEAVEEEIAEVEEVAAEAEVEEIVAEVQEATAEAEVEENVTEVEEAADDAEAAEADAEERS